MANKKHPFRNILIPIAIVLLGLSAYEYYTKREITWYKDPVSAFNETLRKLQTTVRNEEQAPFVVERSQPSDELRAPQGQASGTAETEIVARYAEPGEPRFELVGRVSRVVDGDSLEVRVSGNEFPVRLYGIDTPEFGQPYGRDAGRALTSKLERRTVLIDIVEIDSYGRLVGTVYYEGRNINQLMLAEGHGWWYRQYAKSEDHLEDAEKAARKAGLGLWSQEDPVAPWEWRRDN
ncbi:MAG: thermonuclease family protein [Gammaproteobacteria bacterium]|nr:thermonuclease family protein [Gammaproteobacteria bacterium]